HDDDRVSQMAELKKLARGIEERLPRSNDRPAIEVCSEGSRARRDGRDGDDDDGDRLAFGVNVDYLHDVAIDADGDPGCWWATGSNGADLWNLLRTTSRL